MKTKSLLLLMSLFLTAFLVRGGNIDRETAKKVAVNFYYERYNITVPPDYNSIEVNNLLEKKSDGVTCYYVCTISQGGFVIVSAIDNVVPVLGYSFEGGFDSGYTSCCFTSWMKHYEDQIKQAYLTGTKALPDVKNEWSRLASDNYPPMRLKGNLLSVQPLLVSKWNQGSPYNAMCPADAAGPGGHCYAGCVATAMGQLLYYYRHPDHGIGSYSYNHPDYGTISADFGATTYNWDAMPSSLMRGSDAVAQLLFHLGVSVDMDYGPDGSGMWNHKAAYSLKTYFGFGPETKYYFRDSTSVDWDSLLIANLDRRKPLYYAGWAGVQSTSGHAFVCDGYQGTDYFHFNWGWGGSYDGYFYVDNLTPGGSNFNYAQEVIPLFPDTINISYPDYCSGRKVLSSLDGSVEDGSGWYHYLPDSECSWLINPQDTEHDSVSKITLQFNTLNTEAPDSVIVYDGDTITAPVLGRFSGNTLPSEITSGSDRMLITFESDQTGESAGWIADYRSTLPVYCSGQTTLTEPSGAFSDGSGNKRYNNNSVCKWRIQPPGAQFVTLWFTSFSTADSLDRVVITDLVTHEQLGEFSGSKIPPPVTASSGKMLVIFFTNNTATGDGWDALYTSFGVNTPENEKTGPAAFISPNPAKGSAHLFFQSQNAGKASLEILTPEGKRVFSGKIDKVPGMNDIIISTENLKPAFYILILSADHNVNVLKFIVN